MSALEQVARDHGAFFTADELLNTDFPDPRWAVHGLIPEGLTLLAGAPKLGKSWLALGVGLAIASGRPALGAIDTDAGDVLYAALEDTPRRLKSRLQKMLDGGSAPRGLSVVTMLPEMPRAVDMIAEWLDEHDGARMVVIDVLGKIRPPSGASTDRYENDYRVVGALKRLADNYGVAVVVVTHTRKMADVDAFNTVSGSTGLTGAADTTLVLQRARGESVASLHVTGRDVEESEYAVTFDPQSGAWTLDGDALADAARRAAEVKITAGLGERSAAVIAVVNDHPDGVRATEVAERVGISDKDAGTYLSRAETAGRILRLGRGLYGPVVNVGSVGGSYASNTSYTPCRACGEDLTSPGLTSRCMSDHEAAS